MNRYLTNLQEQIWEFARLAEEYWSFGSNDQKSSNFAPIIRHISRKNLSRKIGFQVGHFVSNYTEYSNEFYIKKLTNLRQAATKSPFDRCERDPDPQRCVEIQDAAEQLIDFLINAKKRWWKLL